MEFRPPMRSVHRPSVGARIAPDAVFAARTIPISPRVTSKVSIKSAARTDMANSENEDPAIAPTRIAVKATCRRCTRAS